MPHNAHTKGDYRSSGQLLIGREVKSCTTYAVSVATNSTGNAQWAGVGFQLTHTSTECVEWLTAHNAPQHLQEMEHSITATTVHSTLTVSQQHLYTLHSTLTVSQQHLYTQHSTLTVSQQHLYTLHRLYHSTVAATPNTLHQLYHLELPSAATLPA